MRKGDVIIKMNKFQRLVEELEKDGFRVLHVEQSQAVVEIPESDSVFVLLHSEEWLQIAAVLLDRDAIQKSANEDALGRAVLRIHSRFLGCRFGYDEDSSLAIQRDIYPDNQNVPHIKTVIEQLDYIANSVLPLFQEALATGAFLDEGQINSVFNGE
jgi:hypothetical protein